MEMWNIIAVAILGGFGLRIGWEAAGVARDAICWASEKAWNVGFK